MVSLRKQNRHNAMRRTQRAAMPLFIDRGFDAVTVTEIATEVEIAASTIYRHFTTKEAIVLWDEHEQAIDDALDKTLRSLPPLDAMRVAFVDVFGDRYENDLGFQLQRVTYIYNTPQVHAAAIEADLKDREELEAPAGRFRNVGARRRLRRVAKEQGQATAEQAH